MNALYNIFTKFLLRVFLIICWWMRNCVSLLVMWTIYDASWSLLTCLVIFDEKLRSHCVLVLYAWMHVRNLRSHSVIEIVASTPVFILSAKHYGASLQIHAFCAGFIEKLKKKRCIFVRNEKELRIMVFCATMFDAFLRIC